MSAPPMMNPNVTGYAPLPALQNEGGAREFLSSRKWPEPFQTSFLQNIQKTPLRYFICDDSGSMCADDGQHIVNDRFVKCTRFQELGDALRFHAGLAHAGAAPTEFRFLNAMGPLRIGFDPMSDSSAHDLFVGQLKEYPSGGTPLCRHVREISQNIASHADQLRATGQRACLIIATDGESSDGDVAAALRPLKDLPVWVVVRLCTNEDKIVDYWNNIDSQLELNMDVLDDLSGEGKEVEKANPWLVYAEPVHRMREFGVSIKEFDLLDERQLGLGDFQRICRLFYGPTIDTLPHPEVDLEGFLHGVQIEANKYPKLLDPVTLKSKPLIDINGARRCYGKSRCVIG